MTMPLVVMGPSSVQTLPVEIRSVRFGTDGRGWLGLTRGQSTDVELRPVLEREYHHKPAGLRTNMLIALGSALFSILSIEIGAAAGSPDRVAAQVVTGIGFLGAGAILRSGENIHGLTTAATIWVNAAIGMAAVFPPPSSCVSSSAKRRGSTATSPARCSPIVRKGCTRRAPRATRC